VRRYEFEYGYLRVILANPNTRMALTAGSLSIAPFGYHAYAATLRCEGLFVGNIENLGTLVATLNRLCTPNFFIFRRIRQRQY
jgi:hypothetical protein